MKPFKLTEALVITIREATVVAKCIMSDELCKHEHFESCLFEAMPFVHAT